MCIEPNDINLETTMSSMLHLVNITINNSFNYDLHAHNLHTDIKIFPPDALS